MRIIDRIAFNCVSCLFFVLSLSTVVEAKEKIEWGKPSAEEWAMTAPTAYPEAPAIVLFDEGKLTMIVGAFAYERHIRIKVLSDAGVSLAGDREFFYSKFDHVAVFEAQTIAPGGEVTRVEESSVFDKEISWLRQRSVAFPAVRPGCILEMRIRTTSRLIDALRSWSFSSDLYTLRSTFCLVVGNGFRFNTGLSNPRDITDPEVKKIAVDTAMQYTWHGKNIPSTPQEPYSAAEENFETRLDIQLRDFNSRSQHMSFARDWKDIGIEYESRVAKLASSAISQIAKEQTAAASSDLEKVQLLYNYTKERFSRLPGYVFPYMDSYDELIKEGNGTQAEINLFFIALLKAAKLTAKPVLISSRQDRQFEPDYPSFFQLSGVITYVELDSNLVFLDASNRYCPFGMLPPQSLVEAGLLVDGRSSQLIRIARIEPRSHRLDYTAMHIESSGDVQCSTQCSLIGYFAPSFGEAMAESDVESYLKDNLLAPIGAPFELKRHSVLIDSNGSCALTIVYSLPGYARIIEQVAYVTPVSFAFRTNPFTSPNRLMPIDFEFAQVRQSLVHISSELPLAEDTTTVPIYLLNGDTLMFARSITRLPDKIVVDSRLQIKVPFIPPTSYDKVRSFFTDVADQQQTELRLSFR